MALVESHPFAYQMESLPTRCATISSDSNLGRWDYMASLIHFNLDDAKWVLPDRNTIPTDVPFFQALRESIPEVCHSHGMLAIGGMTAIFPDRANAEFNKLALENLERSRCGRRRRRRCGCAPRRSSARRAPGLARAGRVDRFKDGCFHGLYLQPAWLGTCSLMVVEAGAAVAPRTRADASETLRNVDGAAPAERGAMPHSRTISVTHRRRQFEPPAPRGPLARISRRDRAPAVRRGRAGRRAGTKPMVVPWVE